MIRLIAYLVLIVACIALGRLYQRRFAPGAGAAGALEPALALKERG